MHSVQVVSLSTLARVRVEILITDVFPMRRGLYLASDDRVIMTAKFMASTGDRLA
jgi:hypothetical protein